jgi:rubredoxin
MKMTCLDCGYVFDEEKGVPAGRIVPNRNALMKTGCAWHKKPENGEAVAAVLPGTKWADVTLDFICPSCGATKDWFE